MTPDLKQTKICIVLLILFAANSSFAIHTHVLDSVRVHHYDSSEIFIAHPPDWKEQNMLKAQVNKEAKKKSRHNLKPERKLKDPKKNNPDPVAEFLDGCLLGVRLIGTTALLVLMYDYVLFEGATGAGFFLGGAILSGLLFIFVCIKLIKLGKKLGKKRKNSASANSKNTAKEKEENAFVMNSR